MALEDILEMGNFYVQLNESIKNIVSITPTFLLKIINDYNECSEEIKNNEVLIRWAWYSHELLPSLYMQSKQKTLQRSITSKEKSQSPLLKLNLSNSFLEADSDSDSESSPKPTTTLPLSSPPRTLPRRHQVLDLRKRDFTKGLPVNVHVNSMNFFGVRGSQIFGNVCVYLSDEDLNSLAAVDVYFRSILCREELWKFKFLSIDEKDTVDLETISTFSDVSWRFLYMQKKNLYKIFKGLEISKLDWERHSELCILQ